jgi:peptide-methionine (R)-S-oxide reductase
MLSMTEMHGSAAGMVPPRALVATTLAQRASLAEQKTCVKYARYADLTLANRAPYFEVSCRPITLKAEDDMEMLSDLVTWGEQFTSFFEPGVYRCARCGVGIYSSADKWKGPCVWPSFRKTLALDNDSGADAAAFADVANYNKYECRVSEVYCKNCDLFIGHRFEDGAAKGDRHPDARWRH